MKAQIWLNANYPKDKREEQTGLYLNKEHGEGEVSLDNFTGLKRLDLTNTRISKIDLSSCKLLDYLVVSGSSLKSFDFSNNPELRYIEIRNNRNELDLSIFSHLTKLEHLDIRGSNFKGSFKPLENCKALKWLDIVENTGQLEGVEHLSSKLAYSFFFKGTNVERLLEPYGYDFTVYQQENKQNID